MSFIDFKSKLDPHLKELIKTTSKKKIPIVISYKNDSKLLKNKILTNNGKLKYEYINAKALSCELSPISIDKLSILPDIKYISYDYKASLCLKNAQLYSGLSHASIFNLTGKGIGIGIIDTGIYPHPDLILKRNSIYSFEDLVNKNKKPYDDNGHGTFISGCIASSGHLSNGLYKGIAPDSNLFMIKAFNSFGLGYLSDIIEAIDMLIENKDKYNIRIMLLPFEFAYIVTKPLLILEEIIAYAIKAGISIIAPAGNHGPEAHSIYSPGNIKEVITVAGLDRLLNTEATVNSFSGRGPTLNGTFKPDVSAPATSITSTNTDTLYIPSSKPLSNLHTPYCISSGTSIACAIIAGACALILEKTPELKPNDLKSMLMLSTINIGENKYAQGNGMFNFEKILK